MDRRKFIRITGTSMASMLISKSFYGNDNSKNARLINLPDKVTAIADGKEIQLAGKNGSVWENQGIVVELKNKKKSLSVFIEASGMELNSVSLFWNIAAGNGKVLNDHWERTYGDVSWHKPPDTEIFPWYFMEYDGNNVNGFGVETGARSFCYWQITRDKLSLTMDTHSGGKGVLLGNRRLEAARIKTIKGKEDESPFTVTRTFMEEMCQQPKLPKQPVYGINDWYFCYGNNSEEKILEHTGLMSSLCDNTDNKPFSVIDDGWFVKKDLSVSNQKFPDMTRLARKIGDLGMRPGIWTRPLISDKGKFKSSLLLTRENNDNVIDPTIPENLETIKAYFRLYEEWGYEMVKFDFTSFDIFGRWGFDMVKNNSITSPGWNMNDRSVTNAEIILNLYAAIRNACNDMYIIGCNTFSHLSAGFFELNRIGDDTSGREWSRTLKMGVNTLAFRGVQHNKFYAADADCVAITSDTPWEKNKQWLDLVAQSGTPLFISAQPDAIKKEQKELIKRSFSRSSRLQDVGEPLDWLESQTPRNWKFGEKNVQFNWE